MADFMDFNAWRDLAAASEQEVLDRQMKDVESSTLEANQALARAQRDAQMQRLKETQGAGVATTTLSSVGSYGDYLKKKQAMQNASAALRGGRIGELGDVRMTVSGDYLKQAGDMSQQLGAKEQRIGAEDASGLAGANRLANERRAREAAAAEAAANRQKTDDEARQGYLNSLVTGVRGRAGAGGTQLDYVGGYNPYADSSWAQSQGGWEAQQARNAGASDAQVRDIWGAYTGKGRWGQGQNSQKNMEREMNPWKTK